MAPGKEITLGMWYSSHRKKYGHAKMSSNGTDKNQLMKQIRIKFRSFNSELAIIN